MQSTTNPSATRLTERSAPQTSRATSERPPSRLAAVVFSVLDPALYGFLVAALIFDAAYARTGEMLWVKSAAWLISIGLVLGVIPRLINLGRVWFVRRRVRAAGEVAAFWLTLFAVVAAIVNAFVHTRDAYAVMPEGLWLSGLTVLLLVLAKVVPALQQPRELV